ncbi:MAG: hypothetical protein SF053_18800 [Bacteroidia bacterium]|nr:hypothetical protein [Bacteroidia bacterium]
MKWLNPLLAGMMRGIFWLKSQAAYLNLRWRRRILPSEARTLAQQYFTLECLRQSQGFNFVIRKPA